MMDAAGKGRAWMALMLAMAMAANAALAAGKTQRSLERGQLPAGFAVGSGDPALSLDVVVADGQVRSVAVADPSVANVRATRSEGKGQTMLSLRADLDVTLKFDLYVSRDGQTFEYASSCAVTPGISGFEMWEYPVREFALGNPRVVVQGKMPCD